MKLSELLRYNTLSLVGQKGTGKTYFSSHLISQCEKFIALDPVGQTANYIKATRAKVTELVTEDEIIKALKRYKKIIFDCSFLKRYEQVYFSDMLSDVILKNHISTAMLIDEAPEFLREGSGGRGYSYSLERLVRIGRNYGIKPVVLVTQRPQQLAKAVYGLSEVYLFFRLNYYLDKERLRQVLGYSSDEFDELSNRLSALAVGQALFVDPATQKVLIVKL